MDWNKPFAVTNISNGRIVVGSLVIHHGETKEVNPLYFSKKAIEALLHYYTLGALEATNDFVSTKVSSSKGYGVTQVESVKNEQGDTHKHVVFNPHKAINTESISTDKPVKVENLLNDSRAVEVEYAEIDKIEAKEFLDQHWKTVQAEVKKLTNKRKLNFYLEVAKEWAVADKKIEILENRISEL